MTTEFSFDATALDRAEKIFRLESRFVAGARDWMSVPASDLPEVAFAGRSNAGKSSLINALTGRKNLARASSKPGRTRQINFFDLGGKLMLADLPGYGYAKVSKAEMADWGEMIETYLSRRRTLKRLFVLIDSRRGVMEADERAFPVFGAAGVSYTVILTKADELSENALRETVEAVETDLKKHGGAFPRVLTTSAEAGTGIPALRALIIKETQGL